MCRALTVLCVAPSREQLSELKRAAVSANWEIAGGATDVEGLKAELELWRPDVIVLDGGIAATGVPIVRAARPGARVLVVGEPGSGPARGADGTCALEELRSAILGLPPVGGPVRT